MKTLLRAKMVRRASLRPQHDRFTFRRHHDFDTLAYSK